MSLGCQAKCQLKAILSSKPPSRFAVLAARRFQVSHIRQEQGIIAGASTSGPGQCPEGSSIVCFRSSCMNETTYRNRRAVQAESEMVRVTVTVEGGHVAEILHKPTGTNPLWTPQWRSIEPSAYDQQTRLEYGSDHEAKLLSGIMGHNLCLDLFGAPDEEELAAGANVLPRMVTPWQAVSVGYIWRRRDFPWLSRWEENHLRTSSPWNGSALACGMEFGLSPMVESRRRMVSRGTLFGVPTFGWAPAKKTLRVDYCAFVRTVNSMPTSVQWDDGGDVLV